MTQKWSYLAEKGIKVVNDLRLEYICFREELDKQKSAKAYQRLHQAGKTDEARQDLARLALIRQQREEAAKKREEKAKGKIFCYTRTAAYIKKFLHSYKVD